MAPLVLALALLGLLFPRAAVAQADDPRRCHGIVANQERLSCYDSSTGRQPAVRAGEEMIGRWRYAPNIDRMSDRRFYNAFLRPASGHEDLMLRIQCDGKLYVSLFGRSFNSFSTSRADNELTYRVGSTTPVNVRQVTYHENWADLDDREAGALLVALETEESLLIRFQGRSAYQYRESAFETTGFKATLSKLREHCPVARRLSTDAYRAVDCMTLSTSQERDWCFEAKQAIAREPRPRAPVPLARPAR